MLFFDTNVLIYARDPRDPKKQNVARRWFELAIDKDVHLVSAQVIGEFFHALSRREFGFGAAQLKDEMAKLSCFSRGETTIDVLARGADLRMRTGYQFWDCVILVNAIDAGCRYFISEDYEHRRVIDSLTIINPFLEDPALILRSLEQH